MKGDEKAAREVRRVYRIEPISLELSTGSEKFKTKQKVSVLYFCPWKQSVLPSKLCSVMYKHCACLALQSQEADHALPGFLGG